ncbi:MAG: ABC transporter permease [Anaerolineae bacterium]|nr:ABC transporter permease [Anaerolineae bacterium]
MPLARFLVRRLLTVPVTLLVITAILYGIIMLAPIEVRAGLYLPRGQSNNPGLRPEVYLQNAIEEHGLDDPYPIQYARWAWRLLQGDWGWSPLLRGDVLEALLERTPPTAELTLYSILFLVPLGIISGGQAAWKRGQAADHGFRLAAFVATSIPPFILGLMLLTIFYAGLNWFPPGRISIAESLEIDAPSFRTITGLLTVDGLLNNRPDITLSAFRHLALPAFTLSMVHWATIGRVTRAAMIEEFSKEYIVAAHGRGLPHQSVVWTHALRNAVVPALNSAALSAAALVMGVFVIEAVFGFPGVSELIVGSMAFAPDTAVAMGFAVYSVLLVLPLMFVFDVLQAVVDPRIRKEVIEG